MSQYDYEQSIWGAGEASLSWTDPTRSRLSQALPALSGLPSGDKVLEVGCGAGRFIRAIKKLKPELNCYGCDISHQALRQAKQWPVQITYNLSEASRLPYADNYFQAVLIFDVLEHAEDVSGLLREIVRVLVPGGIFHCFVPCEKDSLSIWHALDKLHISSGLTRRYAGHIQQFTRRGLTDLIKKHKFTINRTSYSGHGLGQLLDVAVFWAMDRASQKKPGEQINNEFFFSEFNRRWGRWFRPIKSAVNFLVNLASAVKPWFPSPNIHITATKIK